jgi:uncharacterized membrane protein YcaP (DUF421 family)
MGKREIGELDVGELVVTLLISEICSIPIDNPGVPLANAIIPVLFIVSLEIIISTVKNKSSRLKRIVDGEAILLVEKGKIDQHALIENRISIEEFLCSLRQGGVGSINEVDYCILEASGKISVIRRGESVYSHVLISDGEIDLEKLHSLGYDEEWLYKKLSGNGADEIFLFSVSDDGDTNIILKEESHEN